MAEKFNTRRSYEADYRIGYLQRNLTKPTPGETYVVEKYSWLDSISVAAYGYNRVSDIIAANTFLQSRPIEPVTGLPYIHPGDNVFLPASIKPKEAETIPADSPEEIAIEINGKIFKGFEANSINRNLNSISDSFSFTAPLDPDSESFPYLEPYTYLKAKLFIGGELYITGRLEKWNPSASIDKSETTIEARSLSGVLVDCQSNNNSLTYSGTMRQIAGILLKDFGLDIDLPDGEGTNIPKAKREITATVFDFFKKIVNDQGFLITSNIFGDPQILKAAIAEDAIQDLELGVEPVLSMDGNYDGSTRFSEVTAISQSSGSPSNSYTVNDDSLPEHVYRPKIFEAESASASSIEQAAKWELSKTLTSSTVTVVVKGWRNIKGDLWHENVNVNLKATRIHIYRFTKYIIKNVSLTKSENDGNIATLECVLPESYTGEFPKELPWVRS